MVSRENTVLRGQLFEPSDGDPSVSVVRPSVYTIPNALVAEQFTPSSQPQPSETSESQSYLYFYPNLEEDSQYCGALAVGLPERH